MGFFATDRDSQLAYWDNADDEHFAWQTGPTYFASTERDLVQLSGLSTAETLLEIGCGEGGNLYHLGARPGWVGIDFAVPKLAVARRELPAVRVAAADAARLPFADDSFAAVLIRDVLHHVDDRPAVVREAARVLAPGGCLAAIEPNRNSPLIMAQALLVKPERAALRSTARRLRAELIGAGLVGADVIYAQPLPLARVAQHPSLPLGGLATGAGANRLLALADRVSSRLVPRRHWMYLLGRAKKPTS